MNSGNDDWPEEEKEAEEVDPFLSPPSSPRRVPEEVQAWHHGLLLDADAHLAEYGYSCTPYSHISANFHDRQVLLPLLPSLPTAPSVTPSDTVASDQSSSDTALPTLVPSTETPSATLSAASLASTSSSDTSSQDTTSSLSATQASSTALPASPTESSQSGSTSTWPDITVTGKRKELPDDAEVPVAKRVRPGYCLSGEGEAHFDDDTRMYHVLARTVERQNVRRKRDIEMIEAEIVRQDQLREAVAKAEKRKKPLHIEGTKPWKPKQVVKEGSDKDDKGKVEKRKRREDEDGKPSGGPSKKVATPDKVKPAAMPKAKDATPTKEKSNAPELVKDKPASSQASIAGSSKLNPFPPTPSPQKPTPPPVTPVSVSAAPNTPPPAPRKPRSQPPQSYARDSDANSELTNEVTVPALAPLSGKLPPSMPYIFEAVMAKKNREKYTVKARKLVRSGLAAWLKSQLPGDDGNAAPFLTADDDAALLVIGNGLEPSARLWNRIQKLKCERLGVTLPTRYTTVSGNEVLLPAEARRQDEVGLNVVSGDGFFLLPSAPEGPEPWEIPTPMRKIDEEDAAHEEQLLKWKLIYEQREARRERRREGRRMERQWQRLQDQHFADEQQEAQQYEELWLEEVRLQDQRRIERQMRAAVQREEQRFAKLEAIRLQHNIHQPGSAIPPRKRQRPVNGRVSKTGKDLLELAKKRREGDHFHEQEKMYTEYEVSLLRPSKLNPKPLPDFTPRSAARVPRALLAKNRARSFHYKLEKEEEQKQKKPDLPHCLPFRKPGLPASKMQPVTPERAKLLYGSPPHSPKTPTRQTPSLLLTTPPSSTLHGRRPLDYRTPEPPPFSPLTPPRQKSSDPTTPKNPPGRPANYRTPDPPLFSPLTPPAKQDGEKMDLDKKSEPKAKDSVPVRPADFAAPYRHLTPLQEQEYHTRLQMYHWQYDPEPETSAPSMPARTLAPKDKDHDMDDVFSPPSPPSSEMEEMSEEEERALEQMDTGPDDNDGGLQLDDIFDPSPEEEDTEWEVVDLNAKLAKRAAEEEPERGRPRKRTRFDEDATVEGNATASTSSDLDKPSAVNKRLQLTSVPRSPSPLRSSRSCRDIESGGALPADASHLWSKRADRIKRGRNSYDSARYLKSSGYKRGKESNSYSSAPTYERDVVPEWTLGDPVQKKGTPPRLAREEFEWRPTADNPPPLRYMSSLLSPELKKQLQWNEVTNQGITHGAKDHLERLPQTEQQYGWEGNDEGENDAADSPAQASGTNTAETGELPAPVSGDFNTVTYIPPPPPAPALDLMEVLQRLRNSMAMSPATGAAQELTATMDKTSASQQTSLESEPELARSDAIESQVADAAAARQEPSEPQPAQEFSSDELWWESGFNYHGGPGSSPPSIHRITGLEQDAPKKHCVTCTCYISSETPKKHCPTCTCHLHSDTTKTHCPTCKCPAGQPPYPPPPGVTDQQRIVDYERMLVASVKLTNAWNTYFERGRAGAPDEEIGHLLADVLDANNQLGGELEKGGIKYLCEAINMSLAHSEQEVPPQPKPKETPLPKPFRREIETDWRPVHKLDFAEFGDGHPDDADQHIKVVDLEEKPQFLFRVEHKENSAYTKDKHLVAPNPKRKVDSKTFADHLAGKESRSPLLSTYSSWDHAMEKRQELVKGRRKDVTIYVILSKYLPHIYSAVKVAEELGYNERSIEEVALEDFSYEYLVHGAIDKAWIIGVVPAWGKPVPSTLISNGAAIHQIPLPEGWVLGGEGIALTGRRYESWPGIEHPTVKFKIGYSTGAKVFNEDLWDELVRCLGNCEVGVFEGCTRRFHRFGEDYNEDFGCAKCDCDGCRILHGLEPIGDAVQKMVYKYCSCKCKKCNLGDECWCKCEDCMLMKDTLLEGEDEPESTCKCQQTHPLGHARLHWIKATILSDSEEERAELLREYDEKVTAIEEAEKEKQG